MCYYCKGNCHCLLCNIDRNNKTNEIQSENKISFDKIQNSNSNDKIKQNIL